MSFEDENISYGPVRASSHKSCLIALSDTMKVSSMQNNYFAHNSFRLLLEYSIFIIYIEYLVFGLYREVSRFDIGNLYCNFTECLRNYCIINHQTSQYVSTQHTSTLPDVTPHSTYHGSETSVYCPGPPLLTSASFFCVLLLPFGPGMCPRRWETE